MRIIRTKDYRDMSRKAANVISAQVIMKPDCVGAIGHERRGDHGFGYDPLFLPADTPGKTMAELTPGEKNAISHRFHALEDLARKL